MTFARDGGNDIWYAGVSFSPETLCWRPCLMVSLLPSLDPAVDISLVSEMVGVLICEIAATVSIEV